MHVERGESAAYEYADDGGHGTGITGGRTGVVFWVAWLLGCLVAWFLCRARLHSLLLILVAPSSIHREGGDQAGWSPVIGGGERLPTEDSSYIYVHIVAGKESFR